MVEFSKHEGHQNWDVSISEMSCFILSKYYCAVAVHCFLLDVGPFP